MTVFLESPRFPDEISYGSRGGPGYNTTIVESFSGREKRNINWVYPRYEFDASYAVRTTEELYAVLEFFHVAQGKARGFRFKDFTDFTSGSANQAPTFNDQQLGFGDDTEVDFQLTKFYAVGAVAKGRVISKPVGGTVVVALDGVEQLTGWTVDTATGMLTFSVAPAQDVAVSAGFEFDVPVRFDTDDLPATISDFEAMDVSVPLVELRL